MYAQTGNGVSDGQAKIPFGSWCTARQHDRVPTVPNWTDLLSCYRYRYLLRCHVALRLLPMSIPTHFRRCRSRPSVKILMYICV